MNELKNFKNGKIEKMFVDYQKIKKRLTEQKHKVNFYNDVMESTLVTDVGTVSKLLNFKGVGRNTLFKILRKKRLL
ncbi:hypothetical protein EII29_08270 [Leptotrichia sp. OH3620_COT-345]|nr:hypothetical protein EII29_08270 [Leptotrichia sp. OH3620_COT-345]